MFIGDYAFASSIGQEAKLKIDLSRQWNRQFTPESFSLHSFAELNRPVELDLWGNPFISYLPETIFRPFFDANPGNTLRLGMKMNCSCEMLWLYEHRDKYEKHFIEWLYFDLVDDTKIRLVNCAEEDELWELQPEHFAHCKEIPKDVAETNERDEL